jgi:hypothetical protein
MLQVKPDMAALRQRAEKNQLLAKIQGLRGQKDTIFVRREQGQRAAFHAKMRLTAEKDLERLLTANGATTINQLDSDGFNADLWRARALWDVISNDDSPLLLKPDEAARLDKQEHDLEQQIGATFAEIKTRGL